MRYIPKACRKAGEPPFVSEDRGEIKTFEQLNSPITKLATMGRTCHPLKGFVRPKQGTILYPDSMPIKRTNGYDPNAFKLLTKVGYSNDMRKLGKKASKKASNTTSTLGLGYTNPKPVRFSMKKTSTRYIEAGNEDEFISRVSVFDRLEALIARKSLFDLHKAPVVRKSVFERLEISMVRNSIIDRLGPQGKERGGERFEIST